MPIDTAKALVRARIRRWRSVRAGWLVVEPAELTVYRRKFLGRLAAAATFETDRLKATERDAAGNGIWVTFEGPEGEQTCEVFSFSHGNDAETVDSVLSGLLRQAEEERRRLDEESARLKKELEERQRLVREQFAADVWETAEAVWALTKADYAMANAVIAGDWNEARQQYSAVWQQADRLKDAHEVELTAPLKELDEKICAEDGEEVIRQAGSLVRNLAAQVLQTEAFWAKWRKEESTPSPVSPNWDHVPYFLLFSAGYFETVLSTQIEDWTGVSNGLSVLQSTVPVLRHCFKVDLDGLLDAAGSASAERDAGLLAETTRRVESAVAASFKTRHFECADSTPQPDEEHNGTLPE